MNLGCRAVPLGTRVSLIFARAVHHQRRFSVSCQLTWHVYHILSRDIYCLAVILLHWGWQTNLSLSWPYVWLSLFFFSPSFSSLLRLASSSRSIPASPGAPPLDATSGVQEHVAMVSPACVAGYQGALCLPACLARSGPYGRAGVSHSLHRFSAPRLCPPGPRWLLGRSHLPVPADSAEAGKAHAL